MILWKRKIRVPGIFCVCFGILCASHVHAIERKKAEVEIFPLPPIVSKEYSVIFDSAGVDNASGNIVLANKKSWCEIPYHRREFKWVNATIGPVEAYSIRGVASAYRDVYAYDALSNTVIGGRKKYPIKKKIKNVTGMTFHKDFLYVADGFKNVIYKIRLGEEESKVVQMHYAKRGVRGLASDGEFLYVAQRNRIIQYDDFMKDMAEYKFDQSISGLAYVGAGEFVATSEDQPEFYRISF